MTHLLALRLNRTAFALTSQERRYASRWLYLDKAATNSSVFCLTEEIALFFGAIVIAANEGAAFVCGQDSLADLSFGKSVKMSAKNRLQIVVFEAFEESVGIERPRRHQRTH